MRASHKIVILFLAVSICITSFAPTIAIAGEADIGNGPGASGGMGHYLATLLAAPINGVAAAILATADVAGFYSIEELIFTGDSATVFSEGEWDDIVIPWWKTMFYVASMAVIYQMVTLWIGYTTIAGSINPQKMVSFRETAWNMLMVMIFMTQIPLLAKHIFEANAVLVEAIQNTLMTRGLFDTAINGLSVNSFSQAFAGTGSPILDAFIWLGFAGLMLSLNFLYMVRKFVLGVLIAVSPVVAWAWLSGKKTPIMLLMSEIVSNGFMGISHAIVIAFYASMVTYSADGMFSTWWAKLFAISLLIPVSSLLRRFITGWLNLIGIDEEKYARMASTGLGGLMTVATVMSGAMGRQKSGRSASSGGDTGGFDIGGPERSPATVSASSVGGPIGVNGDKVARAEAFTSASKSDAVAKGADTWLGAGIGATSGQSAETVGGLEGQRGNVHFVIPDKSAKGSLASSQAQLDTFSASSREFTPSGDFTMAAPKEEYYGGAPIPRQGNVIVPSAREPAEDRNTDLPTDDNTFLGPIGESTKSLSLAATASAESNVQSKDSPKGWLTLENAGKAAMFTGRLAGKAVKVSAPVYATLGGALGGAAFGLSSGMPRSYMVAGAAAGKKAHDAIEGGAVTGWNFAQDKVNYIKQRSGKNISTLDKPSIK